MSGHEWAVLGIYLAGSIIVGCVFGLLIRATRALMDWRSSRDIPQFSINDWLQVTSGDEEFRRQVMDAIYAQNDLMVDTPAADRVWVMSQEWKDEIGKLAGSHVSAFNYAQYKQHSSRVHRRHTARHPRRGPRGRRIPEVGGAMRDDLDEAPYLADSDHCDKCAEVDQAWTEADLQDKFGPLGPMLLSSAGIPWFFDPNIVENP